MGAKTLTDLSAIQSVITSLNVLVDYAIDDTNPDPQSTDYAEIGVTSVGQNILDYINNSLVLNDVMGAGFTHYLKALTQVQMISTAFQLQYQRMV
ncbi:hypothetical protein JCM19238_4461 [Vibrio ponticus]|nr:hypothetical protein JCM19238_4461 [Vibrio ponticus]